MDISKYKYLLLIFLFFNLTSAQNFPLLISEIMYNPEGNDSDREWIEIVNISSQTFNIFGGRKGWRINDGSNHLFEENNVTLNPGEVLLIVQDKNKFLQENPNFSGKLIQANFSLKNESGVIQIYNENKNLITQVNYSSSYGGNGNGYSIIFQNVWKENNLKGGTPGIYPERIMYEEKKEEIQQNQIVTSSQTQSQNTTSQLSLPPTFSSTTNIFSSTTNIGTSYVPIYSMENEILEPKTLIISEFLPNAEGNDYGKEFVEIYNYGNETINLENFILQTGNKKIKLQGNIEPGEYFIITNKDNNFSIRNSGETVKILYKEEPIFEISYQGKAPENESFSRFSSGWSWSLPTPGKENQKILKETKGRIGIEEEKKYDQISFENSTSSFLTQANNNLNPTDKTIYYLLLALIFIFLVTIIVVWKL